MRRFTLSILVILLVAGSGWASGTSEKRDVKAINALWDEYVQAIVDYDAEAFLDLHTRGAYKMPPQEPMFQLWSGAEEMKKAWAEEKKSVTARMSIKPMETVIWGDHAYSMGTYTLEKDPNNGEKPFQMDGKFLTVLVKNSDGKWQILRDCYNSNVPMSP